MMPVSVIQFNDDRMCVSCFDQVDSDAGNSESQSQLFVRRFLQSLIKLYIFL